MARKKVPDAEAQRLKEDAAREKNWKRWGPYLSERQWGTVREDYSGDGSCWDYFPHDHARSRAYRWGEDGLLGICDRECRLCFALALWNGRDPILKERLFGLANPEGNHGEDVKELYYYLDSTPTHSYMKGLYKYPQAQYPYRRLVDENRSRGRHDPEYELLDTGVFSGNRYFDVFAEYAKAGPDDILIRITVVNRGPDPAELHLLPTLWYRNAWTWGCTHEGCSLKPRIAQAGPEAVVGDHETLGKFRFVAEPLGGAPGGKKGQPLTWLFTDNESNLQRVFGAPNPTKWVKDAFHEYLVEGRKEAVSPRGFGTKAAPVYHLKLPPGGQAVVRLRLCPDAQAPQQAFGPDFDRTFELREDEADAFYDARTPEALDAEERRVMRQAYAGLLWSKQFYHYVVEDWLEGDPDMPKPPRVRRDGRNADWRHLFNRDVISMPDKWEYPWYAAWDLAFHMIPLAHIDPQFAKDQLLLMLREWYMHPNGQLPAYEFNFSDVNPPVHAWACWRVYKIAGASGMQGGRDKLFLQRVFHKLLLNFTWWVNRKDVSGRHIFAGGFLGMDNVGLFDRNTPLPGGSHLEQADGTAWMAFFCGTMLSMALELARDDPAYEDVASKFFEHFVAITDAMNTLGGTGLWNEEDGFYYDQIFADKKATPLRVRSMVGIVPLFACETIEGWVMDRLPGFAKRMRWFLEHRKDLARHITYLERAEKHGEAGVSVTGDKVIDRGARPVPGEPPGAGIGATGNGEPSKCEHSRYLLAIPSRERLERMLRYLLDENEFLSPYGVRSLSRACKDGPEACNISGQTYRIEYVPGDSETGMFGGNSNWRGPIWFPTNFLLVEALQRYHHYYGDSFEVECPTGSGRMMNLGEVAQELERRLTALFLPDPATGRRPCNGEEAKYYDEHFRDLVLFHEFFHGDNGKGLGASHQTGWTGLVARLLRDVGHREVREMKERAESNDEPAASPAAERRKNVAQGASPG